MSLMMVQLESLLPCFSLLARIATSSVGTFDLSIVMLMLQTILGPRGFVDIVTLLQTRVVGIGSEHFSAKEVALFNNQQMFLGSQSNELVGWFEGMGGYLWDGKANQ